MYFIKQFYRFGIWYDEDTKSYYIQNGSACYKEPYESIEEAKNQIRKWIKK